MSRTTRKPHAEFMQIWEEGYVSDSSSYEMMHTRGLMLLEGAPLRGPDGKLDRERILRYVDSEIGSLEYYRLRLQRGILGLTPPAWVPDERFDVSKHVRFAEGVTSLESANLWELAGYYDGVMPITRPLWRYRITELDTGDVAFGMTGHHVSGDGQSGMRLNSLMTKRSPDDAFPDPGDPFVDRRAPRAFELPWLALRGWISRQPSFAAAWRDYWEKSFYRRFRRVGGRILRPIRDRATFGEDGIRTRLPDRHTDYVILDARQVTQCATELGGTLSDLLVAAGILAYQSPDPVSMRYPVSDRSTAKDRPRNKVTDMMLYGSADMGLAGLIASLRSQVVNRDLTAPIDPEVLSRMIGYATLLPWVSSPRYFCGAEIKAIVPFAAGLGDDELTLAGVLYNGTLAVGLTMQLSSDVTAVTRLVGDLMTDSTFPGPISTPSPAATPR